MTVYINIVHFCHIHDITNRGKMATLTAVILWLSNAESLYFVLISSVLFNLLCISNIDLKQLRTIYKCKKCLFLKICDASLLWDPFKAILCEEEREEVIQDTISGPLYVWSLQEESVCSVKLPVHVIRVFCVCLYHWFVCGHCALPFSSIIVKSFGSLKALNKFPVMIIIIFMLPECVC